MADAIELQLSNTSESIYRECAWTEYPLERIDDMIATIRKFRVGYCILVACFSHSSGITEQNTPINVVAIREVRRNCADSIEGRPHQ